VRGVKDDCLLRRRLVKAFILVFAGRWGRRIGARSLCCFENNSAMLFGKMLICFHNMLIGFPVRSEWGVDPLLRRLHSCWWITGIPSAIRFDSTNPH